ncbi:hypothetical protein BDV98DRAFT_573134, partial [Pterulicium gracile]
MASVSPEEPSVVTGCTEGGTSDNGTGEGPRLGRNMFPSQSRFPGLDRPFCCWDSIR